MVISGYALSQSTTGPSDRRTATGFDYAGDHTRSALRCQRVVRIICQVNSLNAVVNPGAPGSELICRGHLPLRFRLTVEACWPVVLQATSPPGSQELLGS